MKNLLSFGLVSMVIVMMVMGCGGINSMNTGMNTQTSNAPASNAPAEKPILVTSKALAKDYDENELAADEKYKGKQLLVSGKVANIAETMGNVTVTLEGHERLKDVMCSFIESEKGNVAKLKKRQQVTLIGTGDGSTAGLYVGLTKCRVP